MTDSFSQVEILKMGFVSIVILIGYSLINRENRKRREAIEAYYGGQKNDR